MSTSHAPWDELGRLAAALCDGALEPAEAARLEEMVGRSEAAERWFLDYVLLNGELYWEHAAAGGASTIATAPAPRRWLSLPGRVSAPLRRAAPYAARLAAAVAVLLLVVVSYWATTRNAGPGNRPVAASQTFATLVAVSDAKWAEPGLYSVGSKLDNSRPIELRSGLAELRFASGASVILEGPARFHLSDVSRGRLASGKLTANVPPAARGFTVESPRAKVVDLGTAFGMVVEADGVSEVHVLAGQVEVDASPAEGQPLKRQLSSGQSARVWLAGNGAQPRIDLIAKSQRQFVRQMPAPLPASGSVAAMRSLVEKHPNLVHHFTFEGRDRNERFNDQRGGMSLGEAIMWSGNGGGALDDQADGPDSTSKAVRTWRGLGDGNTTGIGLQTQSTFQPPAAMTVEMLVLFGGFRRNDDGLVAVALGTRTDQARCGFFAAAVDTGQLVHLFDGDSPWVESGVELAKDEWYYLASSFVVDGKRTQVNTYLANLTRGERQLNHVVQDQWAVGVPAASRLGIGKGFNDLGAHAYPWPGVLDEIAIYDAALSAEALDGHLRALTGGQAAEALVSMPQP